MHLEDISINNYDSISNLVTIQDELVITGLW
jgi:hypothetical protein